MASDHNDNRVQERMIRERDRLTAEGYALKAADGAIDWALAMAARKVSPETDSEAFLVELDRTLLQCERWAAGVVRFLRQ
jgi:hypothetical protein